VQNIRGHLASASFQFKNLKDEADKLRTRLQKVEAGIKGWETLLEALKRSQAVAANVTGTLGAVDREAISAPQFAPETRKPEIPRSFKAKVKTPSPPATHAPPGPSPSD